VTTAAYRRFVDENNLQPRILAALETANPAQPETLQAASRTIRALFDQAQIPPDVAGAVAQAYAALPGKTPAVAVRSSATAEDLPDLSFAGQQETYLNVRGAEAVLDAVKRCWASLWTARAIGYRLQHGIDQSAVSLAVVVQLLVPAETAGILFTANPVNGRRDQVVISASWGLGEAIVGGLVTPDTIIVDKATAPWRWSRGRRKRCCWGCRPASRRATGLEPSGSIWPWSAACGRTWALLPRRRYKGITGNKLDSTQPPGREPRRFCFSVSLVSVTPAILETLEEAQ